MNKSALLIIDVQVGMFEAEGFVLYRSVEVLNTIKALIAKARSNKLPIIYIQHDGGSGSVLEKGSRNWAIHPEISPTAHDIVVEKNTPDSFLNTNLKQVLQNMQISKLYIAGLQTDFCVDTTCRSAKSHGFTNVLIKDGHSTFDNPAIQASEIIDHHNYVLTRFADVISADEIDLIL